VDDGIITGPSVAVSVATATAVWMIVWVLLGLGGVRRPWLWGLVIGAGGFLMALGYLSVRMGG